MKPPDEVKRELVEQWLGKAEEDFGLAKHLVDEGAPYLNAVGFHAQQAAEKYLKAFLVQHQIEFPKTHDIDELLDLVAVGAPDLAQSLRRAAALSAYGVDTRYPIGFPPITLEEAKEAVGLARMVREAIAALLGFSPEASP